MNVNSLPLTVCSRLYFDRFVLMFIMLCIIRLSSYLSYVNDKTTCNFYISATLLMMNLWIHVFVYLSIRTSSVYLFLYRMIWVMCPHSLLKLNVFWIVVYYPQTSPVSMWHVFPRSRRCMIPRTVLISPQISSFIDHPKSFVMESMSNISFAKLSAAYDLFSSELSATSHWVLFVSVIRR